MIQRIVVAALRMPLLVFACAALLIVLGLTAYRELDIEAYPNPCPPLVEVLTRRVPVWDPARMSPPKVGDDIPEPFRGIALRCLELDPAKRCGLREIADRLRSNPSDKRVEERRRDMQQDQAKERERQVEMRIPEQCVQAAAQR